MNEKIELPTASKVSFKSGMWLVCHDGSDVIRLYGSLKSGKEKVYFNESLISEERNFKFKKTKRFKAENGVNYALEFKLLNMRSYEYIFLKEDKTLKRFEMITKKESSISILKTIVLYLVMLVAVVVSTTLIKVMAIVYCIPDFSLLFLGISVGVFTLYIMKKRIKLSFSINEESFE